jgi:hypothetical protein
VQFRQNAYVAKIGFVFWNNTAKPVSRAGCGGLGWPDLEKKVNGRWVAAYSRVYLACQTYPDSWVESGTVYRDVLQFLAFEHGHQMGPELLVDSIDGVYRLRWDFTEGRNASAKGARRVEAISNEFRMVVRSTDRPPLVIDVMSATYCDTTPMKPIGRPVEIPSVRAFPQLGAVTGIVVQAETGDALQDAAVSLLQTSDAKIQSRLRRATDSKGGFAFDSVVPGRYQLRVLRIGEHPDTLTIHPLAGRVDTVRFRMRANRCFGY